MAHTVSCKNQGQANQHTKTKAGRKSTAPTANGLLAHMERQATTTPCAFSRLFQILRKPSQTRPSKPSEERSCLWKRRTVQRAPVPHASSGVTAYTYTTQPDSLHKAQHKQEWLPHDAAEIRLARLRHKKQGTHPDAKPRRKRSKHIFATRPAPGMHHPLRLGSWHGSQQPSALALVFAQLLHDMRCATQEHVAHSTPVPHERESPAVEDGMAPCLKPCSEP